jgi:hypothetical protein
MFRHWDGHAWSEFLSPTPYAPPPPAAAGGPGPAVASSQNPAGASGQGPDSTYGQSTSSADDQSPSGAYSQGSADSGEAPSGFLAGPGAGPDYVAGGTAGWAGQPGGTATAGGPADLRPGLTARQAGAGASGGPVSALALGPSRAQRAVPLVLIGVVLMALAVIVWQVLARSGGDPADPGEPTQPPNTGSVCPPEQDSERAPHPPNSDRVYGGRLSYPLLTSPWSPVDTTETRVPFGRDIAYQSVLVHANYKGGKESWVASILVGELYAGDGFYDPEQASEIVTRCIVRSFYDDAAVTRADVQNKSITLDGHDGWLIETNLHFNIPGLATKSEWVVIAIVATSELTSSLFYASVPEDSPQAAFDGAEAAYEGLRVES